MEIRIDGDLEKTAPAPSKETITSGINSNYINICNSDYLNVAVNVGDSNG